MDVLINREKELDTLSKAWDSERAELVIITGRKLVGKTRILAEFIKGKKGIFHCAGDKESTFQVKDFLIEITNGNCSNIPSGWREFFTYLPEIFPTDERFYLVIDEFSNLIKNDKWFVLNFQKFWDNFVVNTKLFLVITGSNTGLMDKNTISPDSLLYGRKTGIINVNSLSFKHSQPFISNMQLRDRLETYLSVGGIVDYLRKAGKYSSFREFTDEDLKRNGNFFKKEVIELLDRELGNDRETRLVLNALALGYNNSVRIAKHLKSESRKMHPHINKLVHQGFLERIKSAISKEKTRSYFIKDVLVDYWLNKTHGIDYVQEKQIIDDYYQRRFKLFIREEIARQVFNCYDLGPWWGKKDLQIDIVGIEEDQRIIHFGECSWEEEADGERMLKNLRKKSKKIDWYKSSRREMHHLFALSFKRKPMDCECHDLQGINDRFIDQSSNN